MCLHLFCDFIYGDSNNNSMRNRSGLGLFLDNRCIWSVRNRVGSNRIYQNFQDKERRMNMADIVNFQILALISVLTTLTTECVKTFCKKADKPYISNIIATVSAVILSGVVCIAYPVIMKQAEFTPQLVFTAVIMAFFSILCATLTFDKVVQALEKIKG